MDTFGYVVLEAMAHGLPVIAPGHLALNELIGDDSGLRFAPENMLYGDDGLANFPFTMPLPPTYLEALRHPSEALRRRDRGRAHAPRRRRRALRAARRRARSPGSRGSMERRRAELARIYGAAIS